MYVVCMLYVCCMYAVPYTTVSSMRDCWVGCTIDMVQCTIYTMYTVHCTVYDVHYTCRFICQITAIHVHLSSVRCPVSGDLFKYIIH